MAEDNKQESNKHEGHEFHIQIDRKHYTVRQGHMTGAELRALPEPPIGEDRDLFEVVHGNADRKIEDAEVVEIHDGQRFFTAPRHINPGMSK